MSNDPSPCVVFLQQEAAGTSEVNIGSGFLVRSGDVPYLVTAAHVARAVGKQFRIVMPGSDGKAVAGQVRDVSWRESDVADVAVIAFKVTDKEREMLAARSLPSDLLLARELPPSRDIPLTVMGYPLGLGASGYVSPLSLETRAASGFITMQRADTGRPADFILLQDPSIGGLSGGPVFDLGKSYFSGERAMTVRQGWSLVGLVHGVISDKSGGKFTAVVPATFIAPLLAPAAVGAP